MIPKKKIQEIQLVMLLLTFVMVRTYNLRLFLAPQAYRTMEYDTEHMKITNCNGADAYL